MFCAALKSGGGIDFRHIVGDAIQATGNELGIIAKFYQFGIGHIDLLPYSQSDVPFDFPKKYLQCIKCYEFSHNANFNVLQCFPKHIEDVLFCRHIRSERIALQTREPFGLTAYKAVFQRHLIGRQSI